MTTNLIVETIQLQGVSFVIKQGVYNLTADAMRLRDQAPLYSGDDYTFQFTLVDALGAAVNITGLTIKMSIRFSLIDGAAVSVTKSATIVNGAAGRFDVVLARTDVAGPNLRFGKYDIQKTVTSGGPTYSTQTLLSGDIEFLPNITQTVP